MAHGFFESKSPFQRLLVHMVFVDTYNDSKERIRDKVYVTTDIFSGNITKIKKINAVVCASPDITDTTLLLGLGTCVVR